MSGQVEKARELMDRLVSLFNDVGLISEEYDPREQRMIGNFPQAFSHLTFIGAARALAQAERQGAAQPGRQQP
jgi:GH15 family glucan-1,4-alpha-glucosidase